MKVGILTPYYPDEYTVNSGIANHFSVLVKGLSALNIKVVIIHVRQKYSDETGDYEKKEEGNIVKLVYKISLSQRLQKIVENRWSVYSLLLKIKAMRFVAKHLNNIIEQHNIDVIETSSYFSLGVFLKSTAVPVAVRVSTTYDQILSEFYPFKSKLQKIIARLEIKMIKRSKHRVTHSAAHAKLLENRYHVDSNSFAIIPHGVNLPKLTQNNPHQHTTVKVLFVGRLEMRKGIDVLLKAIPLVLESCQNAEFDIVGNDPAGSYQTEFLQNQTSNKVRFWGESSDEKTHNMYNTCDIFVAPSRYESFGLVFAEAMSYGKPVIGCPEGGITDIIGEGYNGLFARTGDAESLASQIIYLINHRDIRLRMGINARLTVEKKFSTEVLINNSLTYYNQIINATEGHYIHL